MISKNIAVFQNQERKSITCPQAKKSGYIPASHQKISKTTTHSNIQREESEKFAAKNGFTKLAEVPLVITQSPHPPISLRKEFQELITTVKKSERKKPFGILVYIINNSHGQGVMQLV